MARNISLAKVATRIGVHEADSEIAGTIFACHAFRFQKIRQGDERRFGRGSLIAPFDAQFPVLRGPPAVDIGDQATSFAGKLGGNGTDSWVSRCKADAESTAA